jgi:GT2 family glycosyltransferase
VTARDVSIVIPSWNGRRLLEEFLPSVIDAAVRYESEDGASVEILVVDDGSTDDTMGWLADQVADTPVPLVTIRNEINLGFGEACNRGVREASHPLVLLLNNDVDVSAEAIAPLVTHFADEPPLGPLVAVHCRVLDFATDREVGTGKMGGFARGFLRVHRSYVTRGPAQGRDSSIFAGGGSALFHRQRFLDLGGFDPLFAPFYFEDVELSYRAWKRGFTVEYEPRSVVRHRFSSTIEPLAGRSIPRIGQRNRLVLHWIHLHDPAWMASHVLWVLVLMIAGPLTLRPRLFTTVFDALRRLPAIRARRRAEKRAAQRRDRDVIAVFEQLAARPDVRAYDDPAELTR